MMAASPARGPKPLKAGGTYLDVVIAVDVAGFGAVVSTTFPSASLVRP